MDKIISTLTSSVFWICLLKYISILINMLVLVKWIRNKIILSKFIAGRWEGKIKNTHTEAILTCFLVVTECAGRDNKAFFYYEQYSNDELTVRGGDELDNYSSNGMFVFNKRWKALFLRQFHISYNDKVDAKEIDFNKRIDYQWYCKILNIWTKPKLNIIIEGNGVNLIGKLHKS